MSHETRVGLILGSQLSLFHGAQLCCQYGASGLEAREASTLQG